MREWRPLSAAVHFGWNILPLTQGPEVMLCLPKVRIQLVESAVPTHIKPQPGFTIPKTKPELASAVSSIIHNRTDHPR